MSENAEPGGVSRRTVTRAMAWAVPAVAVAAAVPIAAASVNEPPPPVFAWSSGCATTGSGGGCAGARKTPQVPFTITNPTAMTVQFQVLGQKSWIGHGAPPANWSPLGGIYANHGTQHSCGPRLDVVGCDGYRSIVLAPGASLSLWFVGSEMGSANEFSMRVHYRWVTSTCGILVAPAEIGAHMSSSTNCK